MDFAADLALFYADFGVDVTHQPAAGGPAVPGRAIFDRPGMAMLGGDVIATDYAIRYQVATFPVVRRGDVFSIDGASYVAREDAQPLLDGLENTVPLARA